MHVFETKHRTNELKRIFSDKAHYLSYFINISFVNITEKFIKTIHFIGIVLVRN